jgi:hypothetical protein
MFQSSSLPYISHDETVVCITSSPHLFYAEQMPPGMHKTSIHVFMSVNHGQLLYTNCDNEDLAVRVAEYAIQSDVLIILIELTDEEVDAIFLALDDITSENEFDDEEDEKDIDTPITHTSHRLH